MIVSSEKQKIFENVMERIESTKDVKEPLVNIRPKSKWLEIKMQEKNLLEIIDNSKFAKNTSPIID